MATGRADDDYCVWQPTPNPKKHSYRLVNRRMPFKCGVLRVILLWAHDVTFCKAIRTCLHGYWEGRWCLMCLIFLLPLLSVTVDRVRKKTAED